MLKSFSVLTLALITLLAVAKLSYTFWQSKYNVDISCIASFTVHNDHSTIHATTSYVFNNKVGFLSLNGYQEEDPSMVFNRKIVFDYRRDNDTYMLRSQQNIKYPDDTVSNDWMAKVFPQFYIFEGKSIYFKVIKQLNNSHLFFIGTLPTFVCKYSQPVRLE
ncbi:hypothetical protein [Enterobacter sp. CC120223-11]|uniref:hypothetical protein n=1 Tax=Enterobacter sp. CC120223-11 TaxID=1378073 RepID=UPI000BD4DBBA|nr:hypothetical protein [Enterobacter sp. CC120223-11]SNY61463.1 FidL-like putative membrane protein [Enterobacter sp. CC120223-11]